MSEMTFLTIEQAYGGMRLDVLKKYGTRCAITDFAILLGGYVLYDYYTSEGNDLKDRTGFWWTKTPYNDNVRVVYKDDVGYWNGDSYWNIVYERNGGARPVIPYSSIQSITSNEVRGVNEILEVEYGEYPQMVVSKDYSLELERGYNNGSLEITGKKYTTDVANDWCSAREFEERIFAEYEYNGGKYIRFVSDSNCDGEELSDGRAIKIGQVYWLKVEPIVWFIDEKEDIALSKKILFSGIQFNNEDYKGDFENTNIKKFMDNYFSKEIIPVVEKDYSKGLENDKEYMEFLKAANVTSLDSSFYEELDKRVNKRVKRR